MKNEHDRYHSLIKTKQNVSCSKIITSDKEISKEKTV